MGQGAPNLKPLKLYVIQSPIYPQRARECIALRVTLTTRVDSMRTKPHRHTGLGRMSLWILLCCGSWIAHAQGPTGAPTETPSSEEPEVQALAAHIERGAESLTQSLGLDRAPGSTQSSETQGGELEGWSAEDMARIQGLGLRPELNRIQFYERTSMNLLRESWRTAKTEGMRIVHVGDSHVQSGVIHHELRAELWPELASDALLDAPDAPRARASGARRARRDASGDAHR